MDNVSAKTSTLKLNYKRTALIGFAFFGILLLWQVYDSWCPSFLTDIFARNIYLLSSAELKDGNHADALLNVQWLVGIVMACDNLAALVLLPLFGNLSDKTNTKIGKRMPFILVGTFVAAVVFPFVPFFFHINSIPGMVIAMGIVLIFMMMYRNPAVSLMPDITPKPLRAKANGVINIMGYFGGAFATVIGIVLAYSKYINGDEEFRANNLWLIETPFLVASVLMVVSALVLFFTVKENKIKEEIKDELEEGERQAAIESPLEDDKPLSGANKKMLLAILGAEFLWFMADNALGTYIGNYVLYGLGQSSSITGTLTIVMGVASVLGFAIAGYIADRIGRKWTITIGLGISILAYAVMLLTMTGALWPLYITFVIKGFGMSLVHNCSFPMVVELSTSKTIGKFTGYYYASSMAAQTATPVLLGLLLTKVGVWMVLPVYVLVLISCAFVVFTTLVKNIKASKVANAKGLEALDSGD